MTLTAELAPAFRRITLALAREEGHPEGDPSDRYVVVAPLDRDDRIDPEMWRERRAACRVLRDDGDQTYVGKLVHGPGGRWMIEYEGAASQPETVFHLKDEQLRAGEYVSIVRNGEAHPYRVAAVSSL